MPADCKDCKNDVPQYITIQGERKQQGKCCGEGSPFYPSGAWMCVGFEARENENND